MLIQEITDVDIFHTEYIGFGIRPRRAGRVVVNLSIKIVLFSNSILHVISLQNIPVVDALPLFSELRT